MGSGYLGTPASGDLVGRTLPCPGGDLGGHGSLLGMVLRVPVLGGGECEGWVSGFGVCDQGLRFSAPLPHGPTPSYATDLVVCVALGCDMFDCVFPTRTAVRPLAGERPSRDWGSQGGG